MLTCHQAIILSQLQIIIPYQENKHQQSFAFGLGTMNAISLDF